MTRKPTYDPKTDMMYISIDVPVEERNIITSEVSELQMYIDLDAKTGGLVGIEILRVKDLIKDVKVGDTISYDPDEDALYVFLTSDSQSGLCDIGFHDAKNVILVALNRNEAGNLSGFEIVGIEKIMDIYKIQQEDESIR